MTLRCNKYGIETLEPSIAFAACPQACQVCPGFLGDECYDDDTWAKKGEPSKDCEIDSVKMPNFVFKTCCAQPCATEIHTNVQARGLLISIRVAALRAYISVRCLLALLLITFVDRPLLYITTLSSLGQVKTIALRMNDAGMRHFLFSSCTQVAMCVQGNLRNLLKWPAFRDESFRNESRFSEMCHAFAILRCTWSQALALLPERFLGLENTLLATSLPLSPSLS